MLHVDIIMLPVDINKSHVNIIMLPFACRGQKYAIIQIRTDNRLLSAMVVYINPPIN